MTEGALEGIDEKCESKKKTTQTMTLECIVLHNICIELEDATPNCWDETVDDMGSKIPQDEVHELLVMTNSPQSHDNNFEAGKIRDALKQKFFLEKRGEGVF